MGEEEGRARSTRADMCLERARDAARTRRRVRGADRRVRFSNAVFVKSSALPESEE